MAKQPDILVFVQTTEYQRFARVCDLACTYRFVAFCLDAAGVGKTAVARHYAHWDGAGSLVSDPNRVSPPDDSPDRPMFRTALYTPRATDTPKKVERGLAALFVRLQRLTNVGTLPYGNGGFR